MGPAKTKSAEALRPAPKTLKEEVRQICFAEGGYPRGWPQHDTCPCCGGHKLRDAFT
jgi:hypothetical protein